MNNPLISIVMPTKNSEKTLELCIQSIKEQIYSNYELIIVDCYSSDHTKEIASQFNVKFFSSDCGRSAARNFGFSKAQGEIYVSIDSDMILEKNVLEDITENINGHGALILPEVGYGSDFISKCKDLEKRCYLGDEIVEAARAFSKSAFEIVNGYDSNLEFGEDWDIHSRIKKEFSIGRAVSKVLHNTQGLSLISYLKKAYSYGNSMPRYLAKGHMKQKEFFDLRNIFFIKYFKKLIKEPILGFGLLFIKCMEYLFGTIGFLAEKISKK